MRVLFSTYSLAFQNPGGGEKVMIESAEALRKLGHTVDFYSPWNHQLKDYDMIHYFSSLETGFWQAVHDQCPHTPLVVTPTQWNTQSAFKYKIKRFLEVLQPKWNHTIASRAKLPTFWLPTTSMEAQFLNRNFSIHQNRMEVIPNAVNPNFKNADASVFRNWSGIKGDFVLHVGRFHPVKNQLSLIQKFKSHSLPLVHIGGPDLDHATYYESCVREAEKSSVKILGPVPMDSNIIPSAYAAAKILVLPSDFETFGLAAFEAISANVPYVLVTQNCAAKMELNNHVEWIDPQNMDYLASRVKEILSVEQVPTKDYSSISILSWDEIGRKIDKIYNRLMTS
jgi:glycosyltransferase involved in cell wall biosynthesis